MISPGFFSLFNAHRGMLTSQMALNTVNHNIANANTKGYTRQRVEIEAHYPYTSPSLQQVNESGQMGQGSIVDKIIRIRDSFLDEQFRDETSITDFNEIIRDVYQVMEGIFAEPSNAGVNTAVQNFFDAAQELTLHPESIAVRADFLQQGVDLVNVFQQQANQLQELQRNLVGDPAIPGSLPISQLGINVEEVNIKLQAIAAVNREINTVLSSGAEPNDFYDQRDVLLDELAELIDIRVTPTANGMIDVEITPNGPGGPIRVIQGVRQLDSLEVVANAPPSAFVPTIVQTVNGGVNISTEMQSGKLRGILDVAGQDPNQTSVQGALVEIDTLLNSIATELNAIQAVGFDLNGVVGGGGPIFTLAAGPGLSIFRYSVNTALINNPDGVAAAQSNNPGDARNALDMAQARDQSYAALGGTTFVEYFNGILSNLGIDTRAYEERSASQNGLIETLDLRRQSVSGVNVDEEMIDMVRFQRGFEASARLVRLFDEIIENIINIT